jgi:hypothetical protein
MPPYRFVAFAGAVLLGAALRLHGIRDQLLVSDEWHAPHAAALASVRQLLHLITFGATSIPLNVYTRVLLDGAGWSELTLRLPALAPGLAALVVFPLLVRRLLRPRAVVLFAYLIALSPFLVFYTRYARPYSLIVLLGFTCLVASHRWAASGRLRDVAMFVGSGVLAGWVHLTEARLVFLPLLLFLILKWVPRSDAAQDGVRPSRRAILLAGCVAAAALAVLFLPGLLDLSQALSPIVGRAHPDAKTMLGALELLSGTANPSACALLVAFAVLGFVLHLSRDRLLAALVLLVVVASVAMVLLARPVDSDVPIVFARYVVVVLPLLLMSAAAGIDVALEWAARRSPLSPASTKAVAFSAAAGALGALFWLGPLPRIHGGRNDFTNHKAFQAAYGPLGAANAYTTRLARLLADGGRAPAFYDRLDAETSCAAIVEYPLPIGDIYSPYFLYQARHQKRVLGGYLRGPSPGGEAGRPGVVRAEWPVDRVLAEVADPTKLRFRNLVDLDDRAALRASGACYLVVHTDLAGELEGACSGGSPATLLGPDYGRRFGEPVFSDACTAAFDLRAPSERPGQSP